MLRLPHDRSEKLSSNGRLTNLFTESIDRWLYSMVEDDFGGQGTEKIIEAVVFSKSSGIFCGELIANRFFNNFFDQIDVIWMVENGEKIYSGDSIVKIIGKAKDILLLERILLNIISRLSGIASNTLRWVEAAKPIKIASTRKTNWGLLDKWAVHIGGGLTHRLSRGDALMIKENDFFSLRSSLESEEENLSNIISSIDMEKFENFVVIEVTDITQGIQVAKSWKLNESNQNKKITIMVDNIGPTQAKEFCDFLISENIRNSFIIEGSGGVTLDSLVDWRSSGVDLVSSSSLNLGIVPLDFSMIFGVGNNG